MGRVTGDRLAALPPVKPKVVAILETRTGEHLGELVARRGGIPLLAPALSEVPDIDPHALAGLLDRWRRDPFRLVIFQTGVGTRAFFQAMDALAATDEMRRLLAGAVVVVRGPKPLGELSARAVRIDIRAAAPFTTDTVLTAIADVAVAGLPVLVQQYGAVNEPLRRALEARGASVEEFTTYRWALPEDLGPLLRLLDALDAGRVDAVVFTSAVQIQNLLTVAQSVGRGEHLVARLNSLVVASIGPVCSRALRAHGVDPTFEADPPKLGPLLAGLEKVLDSLSA